MKGMKFKINVNLINQNRAYLFLLLILFCGLFADNFFTFYNISAVTGNESLVIWLGMGFTLCMIAGHMDLTIMYMSTFGALLCLGLHNNSGLPWVAAILVATFTGVIVGFINGILVTKFKIHSFIATLGMQFVLKGMMYVYTGGAELSIGRDYSFNEVLSGRPIQFLPFSSYFMITTGTVFLIMVVLRYTRFGRNIYMVGGNLETAWLAGIKSNKVTVLTFIISSASCAFGGALNGIYSGSASITMGEKGISPLMIALTATIIGGTAIYGGKGSVIWTWASMLAIAFLKSLCKRTELQVLIIAAILIACVLYETVAQYKRNKNVGMRPNLFKEYKNEIVRSI